MREHKVAGPEERFPSKFRTIDKRESPVCQNNGSMSIRVTKKATVPISSLAHTICTIAFLKEGGESCLYNSESCEPVYFLGLRGGAAEASLLPSDYVQVLFPSIDTI